MPAQSQLLFDQHNIITMKVPLSKFWLPADLQNLVWHMASVTPSAKVIKEVTIESLGNTQQRPRKRITTKGNARALIGMGRSMVNPCLQCEFADDTGAGEYCGTCRSRPTVMQSFYDVSYLGACGSQCRSASPRRSYLNTLQRRTCPKCEHIYWHNRQVAEFIEEEGCCPKCFHSSTPDF